MDTPCYGVPVEAAEWMYYVLMQSPGGCQVTSARLIDTTQGKGLLLLKVNQLKRIFAYMHHELEFVKRTSNTGSLGSMKKTQIVQVIRNLCYEDPPHCTKKHSAGMKQMADKANVRRQHVEHQQQQSAQALARLAHGPIPVARAPVLVMGSLVPIPYAASHATATHTPRNATSGTNSSSNKRPRLPEADSDPAAAVRAAFDAFINRGVSPNSDSSGSERVWGPMDTFRQRLSAPFVPPPPNSDPECHAQNEQEHRLLMSLQAVGFQNIKEILVSVRRLVAKAGDNASSITSDEVMCDITAMRDMAAEAALMDQARLESEKTRQAEAEARRASVEQERQETLSKASITEWRNDRTMFRGSWILDDDKFRPVLEEALATAERSKSVSSLCSDLKQKILCLLEWEKKSRKWYSALPRDYFVDHVITTLSPLLTIRDIPQATQQVQVVIDRISKGVSSLDAQSHGVPKIFLAAKDEASRRGGYKEGVIVVIESLVEENHENGITKPPSKGESKQVEVIEIL